MGGTRRHSLQPSTEYAVRRFGTRSDYRTYAELTDCFGASIGVG
jgi:hypothetical protein